MARADMSYRTFLRHFYRKYPIYKRVRDFAIILPLKRRPRLRRLSRRPSRASLRSRPMTLSNRRSPSCSYNDKPSSDISLNTDRNEVKIWSRKEFDESKLKKIQDFQRFPRCSTPKKILVENRPDATTERNFESAKVSEEHITLRDSSIKDPQVLQELSFSSRLDSIGRLSESSEVLRDQFVHEIGSDTPSFDIRNDSFLTSTMLCQKYDDSSRSESSISSKTLKRSLYDGAIKIFRKGPSKDISDRTKTSQEENENTIDDETPPNLVSEGDVTVLSPDQPIIDVAEPAFSFKRIHESLRNYLAREFRVQIPSSVYLSSVLEYLSRKVLNISKSILLQEGEDESEITHKHIYMAFKWDSDLCFLTKDVLIPF